MTIYSGTIGVSGTLEDSLGGGTFSGSLLDTFTANLDSAGTGVGSDTLTGTIDVNFSLFGVNDSDVVPVNVTENNIPFQSGVYTVNATVPVASLGTDINVTLTGSVNGNQTEISGNATGNLSGSFDSVPFTGTFTGTGTLNALTFAITSPGGDTNQPVQMISGTALAADAGNVVSILDGSTQIGTATVQADGDWSVGLTLAAGAQSITATEVSNGTSLVSNAVSFSVGSATSPTGILESLTPAEEIAGIYIGYFDRGPDAAGFSFWESQYTQALSGGQSTDQALKNIANSFAPQPETLALYPFLSTSLDPNSAADVTGVDNLIVSVYANLFGRTPAATDSGVQYWAGQILTGQVGLGQAILDIANGATGADAATVLNKVVVASYLAAEEVALGIGTTAPVPAALVSQLHSVLASVTSDPATVSVAEAASLTGSDATTSASSSASQMSSSDIVQPTGIPAASHQSHHIHFGA
jgi:hypothetical protein